MGVRFKCLIEKTEGAGRTAEEVNSGYHWLAAATLEQARAFVDQAEKTEAVRLITERFDEIQSGL